MRAGCFDELPGDRAQQLAVLDTAVKVGSRVRRNKAIGQSVLFGDQTDPDRHMAANLPDVPPLTIQELARQENEALGLYVRYDPLAEHRAKLGRFCTAFSDELPGLGEGVPVVMGGVVEHVARRTTRTKDTMGVLKVLDPRGAFECVLFPRAWEKYREQLAVGSISLLAGQVSHRRGAALQLDEAIPLEKAQDRLAASVLVTVPCRDASPQLWEDLKQVVQDNRGKVPCYVDLTGEGFRLRARIGNGNTVAPSDRLAAEVEELVGFGTVRFGIRDGAAAPAGRGRRQWPQRSDRRG
jgi:DNA polymerase-3 subunit alpha